MKRFVIALACAFLFFMAAREDTISAETANPRAECHALDLKQSTLAKVGFDLATTFCGDYTLSRSPFVQSGRQTATAAADNPLLMTRMLDGEQHVILDATAQGDSQQLLSELEALGLQNGVAFGPLVSGYFPISALGDAAALSSLNFARPALATRHVGATTSQGDAAMQTDDFRKIHNITGSSITIGTLSDSYNCQSGAAADIASGDLPTGIVVLQEEIGCGSGSDEGRAMMQLIHDVAPGAAQSFHSAFGGRADFAQGIIDLQQAGADVIVDDVGYFAEPFYQDGIIAQAVDTVVADGALYFSSAGNAARNAYESPFRNGSAFSVTFSNGVANYVGHNFATNGEDTTLSLNVPVNQTARIIFQWAEPYASANSGSSGSASDLDIYIRTASGFVAGGTSNNLGGDPTEIFTFTNNGSFGTTVFDLVIGLYDGPAPSLMKFHYSGNGVSLNEHATNSGTSFGHSIAAGGISVGAVFFANTPEFGASTPTLEWFSSAGGQRILFDGNDNAIDVLRNKPDLVAPDGTNTTFFGSDTSADADTFPNFFGTSAAAPHAAAYAALILDQAAATRALTPQEVYAKMIDSATDMGSPGFDFDSGAGLIQASALDLSTPTAVGLIAHGASGNVFIALGVLMVLLVGLTVWLRPKTNTP